MTARSETILFSSTPSDFSEPTHINVHPIIDWFRLFAEFSFAPDDKFDARFIAYQAMLFRRVKVRPSDQTLCRLADVKTRQELEDKKAALEAILNSRGWRLMNRYRDLRFRVRHPITRAIRWLKRFIDP
jgi:hypothetical protein